MMADSKAAFRAVISMPTRPSPRHWCTVPAAEGMVILPSGVLARIGAVRV
ncbi:hypothetical protein [Paracidovorax anthurii]|uniref:Uncharacterized protein n=1 Tax=Paracidovorax anthurii TaxID=78229 RepID=A0A328ZFB8_9BURK|nr:hypothetical protein [Paracidovorax anthurii]RAR84848.1 hypothetical protein AX018_100980 [Paracidovorax anthurii]